MPDEKRKEIKMGFYDIFELKVLYDKRSEFQDIRVDGSEIGKVLFLDNIIQLTTWDSHRYHECMAVVPYLYTRFAKNILILGGGDGQSAKTLLDTFPEIETIVMVELDKDVVTVARGFFDFPDNHKLKIVYQDAREWVKASAGRKVFDLVIADYTDPSFIYAAKLFTTDHFVDIQQLMKPNGVFAVQMISPLANPKATSCLISTMKTAFPKHMVAPYKVHMPMQPAPAHQGFCLASPQPMQLQVPQGMKYLNSFNIMSMFWFDNDEKYIEMSASTEKNLLYHRLCREMYNKDIKEWSE
jgi:spermidine synthase